MDYLLIALNTFSTQKELFLDYFLVGDGAELESVRDLYIMKGLRINYPELDIPIHGE